MFSKVFFIIACFSSSSISEIRNFSNNEFTDDENRQYTHEEGLSVEDNPNFVDIFPGVYPTHTTIPKTGFTCRGKLMWHYYADPETECQVFHICETQYSKLSFICPVGSIFNQKHLICDWFYNFECSRAVSFYQTSKEFNEEDRLDEVKKARDAIGFDLNLASSVETVPLINDTKIASVFQRDNRPRTLHRNQDEK